MNLESDATRALTVEECLGRLRTTRIGRVAVSWRALPLILPVAYRLSGRTVIVDARTGTTLEMATDQRVVAFEAEGPPGAIDPTWSVLGVGLAHHDPLAPTDQGDLVRIAVELAQLTGLEAPSPPAPPSSQR